MIITAKSNSELEGLFKQFYEQMVSEKKMISQIVENLSGIVPVDIDSLDKSPSWYRKGYAGLWDYNYIKFSEGSQPLNMVSICDKGIIYYHPNHSQESANKFMREWRRLFKGWNGNIFAHFGIPIVTDFACYKWRPISYNGKYGIEVSDGIIRYLPKIQYKQYEI